MEFYFLEHVELMILTGVWYFSVTEVCMFYTWLTETRCFLHWASVQCCPTALFHTNFTWWDFMNLF